MTDWLSVAERGLKAVRFGIFRANDNLAYLLEGLCCAPEESKDNCGSCGRPKDAAHRPDCRNPDAREFAFDDVPTVHHPSSAPADYPLAGSVVAPSPKQGSDSPPRDSAIPPAPSGGTPTCRHCLDPIELLIEQHPQYGRVGVWMHVGGEGLCSRRTYASPK